MAIVSDMAIPTYTMTLVNTLDALRPLLQRSETEGQWKALFEQVRQDIQRETHQTQSLLHRVAQQLEAAEERAREAEREAAQLREENRQKEARLCHLEKQILLLQQKNLEDPLTGAFNRRFLDISLQSLIEEAQPMAQPVAVAVVDADDFKTINDRFGHDIGDKVLKTLVQIMCEHCREQDRVVRYGGEEFVLVFPNTDQHRAFFICERIRLAIAGYPWATIHPQLSVTVSIGLTDNNECCIQAEDVLLQADRLLYQAKWRGKNCTIWHK